jgi:hypothetical protein
MTAKLIRRLRIRHAIIVGFIAVSGFLLIKYYQYEKIQEATTRHYTSLESLLNDVQSLGGQVILCRNGVCRDIQTREQVANGQNGYYIVYPKDAFKSTDAERAVLEHQGAELKRLTSSDQHL